MIERKRRRHTARQSLGWCAAAIAVAMAVAATGCSSNNSGGSNGTPGNFVRVGTLDSVQSFDFWTTNDTLLDDTAAIIYPLLVQYNLHTKSFEPDFATSWRTSAERPTPVSACCRLKLNALTMTIPRIAIARTPATRATALLMPEAVPA